MKTLRDKAIDYVKKTLCNSIPDMWSVMEGTEHKIPAFEAGYNLSKSEMIETKSGMCTNGTYIYYKSGFTDLYVLETETETLNFKTKEELNTKIKEYEKRNIKAYTRYDK